MKDKNPIEEIWRIREEIGAEHGYDVDCLFAAMREKEKNYGNRVVQRISRPLSERPETVLRDEPPREPE